MSHTLLFSAPATRRSLLSLAISLTICANAPAWAQSQTTSASEDESITLDAVTVTAQAGKTPTTEGTESYTTDVMSTATRLSLPIRHTPQSVSVVTRQMIDDMALESITDVVNITTGVTSKAFDSSRSGFSARGFDIQSTGGRRTYHLEQWLGSGRNRDGYADLRPGRDRARRHRFGYGYG